jgi:glycoside/pentoside/hexuronide:cation symporter, GPH family
MNTLTSKLTFREKLGYGLGDTASHFVWDMVGFWILIFYTDIYGLSPAVAGTIMLIARFWDMAVDPIVGVISDRTNTKWGKFRPYLLFGAIPYAILAVMTFTTPNFGEFGKIIYAASTYVLLMTAYAFINLPYSSLGAVMTSDTYERAGLNTYRFIAGFGGQFIVTGLALTIAIYFGGGDKISTKIISSPTTHSQISLVDNDSIKYTPAQGFVGIDTFEYQITKHDTLTSSAKIFVIVTNKNDSIWSSDTTNPFILASKGNKSLASLPINTSKRLPQAINDTIHLNEKKSSITYSITKNDKIVNWAKGYQSTLILFSLLSLVFFFITFKSTKEVIQPPKSQVNSVSKDFGSLFSNRSWIILACVGIVSFVMFAMQNAAIAYYFKYFIGKETNVQWFNVIGTVALIIALPFAKPLAKRFGNKNVFIASSIVSGIFFMSIYLPAAHNLVTIYVLNILAKMAYAPAVPLLWTMIADSADYGEWKTGRRATGLYFSAAVFAQKAGWGIGAAIAGWILAVSHYVANVQQTATAITGIKLLVSVIPGILYMSCAIFMIFYNIDSKTTDQMKIDLDARREKELKQA